MILIAPQLFLYFFCISVLSSASDTLAVNQSLSGNQKLVSLNGNFEMGFFKPGKCPNYYIGIWYNKAKVTVETPVPDYNSYTYNYLRQCVNSKFRPSVETIIWIANTDAPIYEPFYSKLKIIDGNLVLLDKSNTQIWSTNKNSSATIASVVLLDDGNLVLRHKSNSSPPIWKSFDHLTNTLAANQSLSGNQTLISLAGNFEMGFFKPGESQYYYIGIWYKQVEGRTIVWVANRETPISDSFSSKLIIIDGNLVLLDESNTQIWSTNMNTTFTQAASVFLLDDGNLVLRNGSSSSPPVWQSFEHPTDTFMPGGKLGYNKRTNTNLILSSWRNLNDPAVGLFSLEVDQNKKLCVLKWNRSVEYWASGHRNNQTNTISLIPDVSSDPTYNFRYTDNENESYVTFFWYEPSTFSSIGIGISGQITMQSWSDEDKAWILIWPEKLKFCDIYGVCGPFSVCSEKTFPSCICLIAFKPRSKTDRNLENFSGGCVRKTEVKCSVTMEKPEFILTYLKKSVLSAFLRNETLQLHESASACRHSCLDDCVCNAYSFVSNVCQHWKLENLNKISLWFVSDDSYLDKSQIYIKVSSTDLPHRSKNKDVNLGGVVGSVVGAVFILGLFVFIIFIKKKIMVRKTTMEGLLVAFAYRDLQLATKKFSDKLGGGSFGSVFRGVLHDSSIVAVKKLEGVSQGEKEFRSEVSTIGNIHHVNLVRLRGFCSQGKSRLLVYDYMPNGSLNSHLFSEKQDNLLTWKTRYEIALGIARGLVYLHEKCRDCIIHCDIKPENILLDANFCPKIADFGLAKLVGRDFSRVLTTMRGTRGYLAPEWLSGLAVTAKVDVYSYGMMLFELIHGKRNVHQSEDWSFSFFPNMAANVLMAGGDILSLLDSRLNREANVEEIIKIFQVAFWCIQHEEDIRPSMSEVEHILEGVTNVSMPPFLQYVKFFADDMEDDLFFKQTSSTANSQVQTKFTG